MLIDRASDIARRVLGAVRVRQLVDQLRHRLSFVPGIYVIASIIVAQVSLGIDRRIDADRLPELLATSVDGARSVFTAIAGGLITAITLLLSMMLVAVQLASSQFSPRTLRDWLGDGVLKHTIGATLGTAVFSLLALRSTRSFSESDVQVVPNLSVAIALVFALGSLFAVVQSVDHLTHSLRIGSVARRLATDTIAVIEATSSLRAGQDPRNVPAAGAGVAAATGDGDLTNSSSHATPISERALPIEAPLSGWVQQIDVDALLEQLPDGATAWVVVPLGGFVPEGTPLVWIDLPGDKSDESDEVADAVLEAFAIGDTRTMQQDIAFGIMQLSDIAVRAMSPGVNDPNTAADIVVHLGDVLLALWSQPDESGVIEKDGRRLLQHPTRHGEHLSRAIDPIRRYAHADPHVLSTIVATLQLVSDEAVRRELPGPLEPLRTMIDDVGTHADRSLWSALERSEFDDFVAR